LTAQVLADSTNAFFGKYQNPMASLKCSSHARGVHWVAAYARAKAVETVKRLSRNWPLIRAAKVVPMPRPKDLCSAGLGAERGAPARAAQNRGGPVPHELSTVP
jgi:hypothetical protein